MSALGHLSQRSILAAFMMIFLVIGPFSITELNKINVLILFLLSSVTLFFCLLCGRKLRFHSLSLIPSLFYLASFIVSLFAILLTRDYLTGEYVSGVIFGRLFTFLTVIFTVLIVNLWLSQVDRRQLEKALKVAFSIGLVFILLGHWQFIGNLLGIPFFIETRDWMHGVPAAIRSVVPRRLTSIAEEPNFLSPLLVEYIVLASLVIVRKKVKVIAYALGVFVIIFSFSGGVYINVMLLVMCIGFLSLYRSLISGHLKGQDFIFLFLVLLVGAILLSVGDILVEFLYYKFQGEAAGKSARSQFLTSLIVLISDSKASQLIFGHGMATMSVLTDFGLAKEEFLFRITNNFYLDMIWEGGFLGLTFVLLFFSYLLFIGFKHYLDNKYFEAGLLLTIHMMITCLYRSEYLSSHFMWVMTLIFICYRLGSMTNSSKKNESSNLDAPISNLKAYS
ncbi:hypothetical protein [Shewanella halifaxensis]|uniref:hypothetical protein n=1 Tax=Shewanella halifaxensis TaxID=271098 RepID=UPI0013A6514A|nr:hypothetical protein [Shewanella halifaxensis]